MERDKENRYKDAEELIARLSGKTKEEKEPERNEIKQEDNRQKEEKSKIDSATTEKKEPALVKCPECGRRNDQKDTFECRICKRDYLCNDHYVKDIRACEACRDADDELWTTCLENQGYIKKSDIKFHAKEAREAQARYQKEEEEKKQGEIIKTTARSR